MGDVPSFTAEQAQRLSQLGLVKPQTAALFGPPAPPPVTPIGPPVAPPPAPPSPGIPLGRSVDDQLATAETMGERQDPTGVLEPLDDRLGVWAGSGPVEKAQAEAKREAAIDPVAGLAQPAPTITQPPATPAPAPAPEAPKPKPKAQGGAGAPAIPDTRRAALEEHQKLLQEEQNAQDKVTDVGVQRAREGAAILSETAAQDRATLAEDAAKRAKEDADTEAGIRDIQAQVKAYGDQKIDPARMYSGAGAATQVANGIGGILGGVLGVFNGTNVNSYVQNVDRMIDRDIKAQEIDLQTKGRSIDAQRGVLSDMMRFTGDKRAARSAARIAALSNAKLQFEAKAAQYDAPEMMAKADVARKAFDTKISDEQGALSELLRKEAEAKRAAASAHAESQRRWEADYRLKAGALGLEADRNNIAREKAGLAGGSYAADVKEVEDLFAQAADTGGRLSSKPFENPDLRRAMGTQLVSILRGQGDSDTVTQDTYRDLLPGPYDSQEQVLAKLNIAKVMIANKRRKAAAAAPSTDGVQFTPDAK